MSWLQTIQTTDLHLFQWCWSRRSSLVYSNLSRTISKTADGGLYLLFLVAYTAIAQQESVGFTKSILLAFTIERCIYFVMKNSCRRNRPADTIEGFQSVIIPSDKFSFPSGHTSAAFLFAVYVSQLFPILIPLLFIWAALVGLSRVFLGVHFPFDTVVGASLGSSIAFIMISQGSLL